MSDSDYPLQKKRHTFEYLRTIAHLRPRSNAFSAVFRVRSVAAYAIHKFFQDQGFVYTNTPILTGSDCEGAGEMFRITTLDLDNVPKTEKGMVENRRNIGVEIIDIDESVGDTDRFLPVCSTGEGQQCCTVIVRTFHRLCGCTAGNYFILHFGL